MQSSQGQLICGGWDGCLRLYQDGKESESMLWRDKHNKDEPIRGLVLDAHDNLVVANDAALLFLSADLSKELARIPAREINTCSYELTSLPVEQPEATQEEQRPLLLVGSPLGLAGGLSRGQECAQDHHSSA